MKTKSVIASILVPLSITGCVSGYIAPESGPNAKFSIKSLSNFSMTVVHYADDKKCTGATIVRTGLTPYSDFTTTIRANVNEVFAFQPIQFNGSIVSSCKLLPSFIPQPNGNYTATVTVKDNICSMNIVDESTKENVKNIVMREYNQPFVESQGFCKPLAE